MKSPYSIGDIVHYPKEYEPKYPLYVVAVCANFAAYENNMHKAPPYGYIISEQSDTPVSIFSNLNNYKQ